MKTIGQTLKDARNKKKLSIGSLSLKTRIKRNFLESIEKEDWGKLPEFPVVMGFVKNMAGHLDLNIAGASALLKRDYPPKEVRLNPKPDVSKRFVWGPRLTFLLGIIVVSIGVFGYLIYQYLGFISPPKLAVENPRQDQVITNLNVFVSGRTESDATVKVNNQPVIVDDEGFFSTDLEVSETTTEIIVVANSRSGKETSKKVNIKVQLGNSE